MNEHLKDTYISELYQGILKLKTPEECAAFFEDLCTISELKSMSQRLAVAQMLDEKCIYTDIASKTSASTATISRVNRCLLYGSGGYKLVLARLKEAQDA